MGEDKGVGWTTAYWDAAHPNVNKISKTVSAEEQKCWQCCERRTAPWTRQSEAELERELELKDLLRALASTKNAKENNFAGVMIHFRHAWYAHADEIGACVVERQWHMARQVAPSEGGGHMPRQARTCATGRPTTQPQWLHSCRDTFPSWPSGSQRAQQQQQPSRDQQPQAASCTSCHSSSWLDHMCTWARTRRTPSGAAARFAISRSRAWPCRRWRGGCGAGSVQRACCAGASTRPGAGVGEERAARPCFLRHLAVLQSATVPSHRCSPP